LDIAQIARATGFSREWANKSISVLVSTKLIVSGGRNGPGPAWYWLTAKRLAGSEPVGFNPLTPKPAPPVQEEQDQERPATEQPTTPDAPERDIVPSPPQPQGLIAQADRDVRASLLTESPADKRNESPGDAAGEDETPAALITGSGSWSSPQDSRPGDSALLDAIARPVQGPAADQPTERRPDVGQEPQMKEAGPESRSEGSEAQGAAQQEGKSQEAQTTINKTEPAPTTSQAEANLPTAEKPALPNAPQQPVSTPMQPVQATLPSTSTPAPTGGEKRAIAPVPIPTKRTPPATSVKTEFPGQPYTASRAARSPSAALANEIHRLASCIVRQPADAKMILALEGTADNDLKRLRTLLEEMNKRGEGYDPTYPTMFINEVFRKCHQP
jgi:hypothetical protein